MMTKSWTLYIALSLFILSGCDIIEEPYLKEREEDTGADQDPLNIMIVDFTGATCKSCPDAHRTIEQLQELYPGRIIPVAMHLGFFAVPQSGDKFNTDFRTEEGAAMENYYPFVSFPTGLIQSLAKDDLLPHGNWPSEVVNLIDKESLFSIDLESVFEGGNLTATVDVVIESAVEQSGSWYLAAYLLENKIYDWQKDGSQSPADVPDYEHNHVFRKSFSGTWGEAITKTSWLNGEMLNVTLSTSISESWNPENCEVVVFIYEEENRSVLQAEKVNLLK